jgi:hypothetical protein
VTLFQFELGPHVGGGLVSPGPVFLQALQDDFSEVVGEMGVELLRKVSKMGLE